MTAGFANATYVFERQGQDWIYRFSIMPGREGEGLWEDFAQVVAINECTLLLGTPGEFGNSAYVFKLCGQKQALRDYRKIAGVYGRALPAHKPPMLPPTTRMERGSDIKPSDR